MSLHGSRAFRKYVATLPAATLVEQWESHVAKVGGKVFALCGRDGDHVTFKVTELSFEALTGIDGVGHVLTVESLEPPLGVISLQQHRAMRSALRRDDNEPGPRGPTAA